MAQFDFADLQRSAWRLCDWSKLYRQYIDLVPVDMRDTKTLQEIGDEITRRRRDTVIRRIVDVHSYNDAAEAADARITSVAEVAFKDAWQRKDTGITLVEQHVVQVEGRTYRLDFAIPAWNICIEIDGRAFHSDQYSFVNDRRRQRALERAGWRLIRFAAKEVLTEADSCVVETLRSLMTIDDSTPLGGSGQDGRGDHDE